MNVRTVMVVAVSLAFVSTACSNDDTAAVVDEPSGGSTTDAPWATGATNDPIDSTPPTPPTSPTSQALEQDTSTPSTSVSAAPSSPLTASQLCLGLRNEPYETRKLWLAEAPETADVRSACPDLVAVLDDATAVEQASRSIAVEDRLPMVADELTCVAGELLRFTFTNVFDVPIGGWFTTSTTAEGSTAAVDVDATATWNLAPGEQRLIEVGEVSGTATRCVVRGDIFVADLPDLPGDASAPDGATEPDAGDPAVWLPAVLEREDVFDTNGDPLLVASFEDLRSAAYGRLVDEATSEASSTTSTVDTSDLTYSVCEVVAQPDQRHAAIVYNTVGSVSREVDREITVEQIDRLRAGAYRLGDDGRWRWLGTALRIDAPFKTCDDWLAR